MPDGTGANRDEIYRAIETLTPGELLKLKRFSVWRMQGLGRANCGRTWEDLLGAANLATLQGAASNNGTGRRWNGNVDLVTHLSSVMRSISSHWKRDFDEQEAELESEILTHNEEGEALSPLDKAASDAPSQERQVAAKQQWDRIAARCKASRVANRVLEGLSLGLSASAIMDAGKLSKWEYQQALKRIRLHANEIDH